MAPLIDRFAYLKAKASRNIPIKKPRAMIGSDVKNKL